MKTVLTLVIGAALLALPMAAIAGVDGGDHDLVDGTGTTNDVSALTNLDLCTSCHLPHNAEAGAARLWAQAVGSAAGVAGLCQSCHDGTVAAEQITTGSQPFDNHLHYGTLVADYASCSGAGTSCHDVHTQNADGTGKFLTTAAASTGQCADCHNGVAHTNFTLADKFLQTENHPQDGSFGCGDCHSISVVHGTGTVVTQSGSVEPVAGQWLLPIDNNTANAWGGVCVACHETNTAPYTGTVTTEGYTLATFKNSSPASLLGRHVTDGSGPNHTQTLGGCDDCHFVHSMPGGGGIEMLQKVDNTDSDGCVDCHSNVANAPIFGANSHPVDADPSFTFPAAFPLSDEIDDANHGDANDYGSAVSQIVCESCHSVHRDGVATTQFLRANNDNDAVCSACHTAN
ncbi:MAG: hypothetical protein OEV49_12520 [candidate division Zixibacteria bacterium]|nr:hypothetical protein [candidate division Zixibacteria bacterium]MDH3935900.1 hypothetical protein [candidate division Zixibacteria bacterium]MDH4032486.1 hypothetical protein [candidate division Zixibacteria bacterium]